MKLKERLSTYEDIEVPYEVWTCFGENCKHIRTFGDQATLGEDFATLEQLRAAIDWYADQLGGKVKWGKK
jgi:hypothetical protein